MCTFTFGHFHCFCVGQMVAPAKVSFALLKKRVCAKYRFVVSKIGLFRRCWFSTDKTIGPVNGNIAVVETTREEIQLNKVKAAPQYYTPRGDGKRDAFGLILWKNGGQIANYPLFEESIQRSKVAWNVYNGLTSQERAIYLAHLRAIEERRLTYKCPITGSTVMTISQLLVNKKCCGSACRHCPYEHENVPADKKGEKIWNGVYYV